MSLTMLLMNVAATWFMTGLIWFVQVVHYPLMAGVGGDGYAGYQRRHMTRTTWVVAPAMLVEMVTALALVRWRPEAVPMAAVWAGIAGVAVVWASTGMLQVPAHETLAQGFTAAAHRRLVRSNWVRTLAWSGRAGLATWMLWRVCAT